MTTTPCAVLLTALLLGTPQAATALPMTLEASITTRWLPTSDDPFRTMTESTGVGTRRLDVQHQPLAVTLPIPNVRGFDFSGGLDYASLYFRNGAGADLGGFELLRFSDFIYAFTRECLRPGQCTDQFWDAQSAPLPDQLRLPASPDLFASLDLFTIPQALYYGFDCSIFGSTYCQSTLTVGFELTPTPEPATLILVGGTVAAAGWIRHRRRRSTPR